MADMYAISLLEILNDEKLLRVLGIPFPLKIL